MSTTNNNLPTPPLLPRSAWQNKSAFFKVLLKTKQALDMAEIAAKLWD